MFFFSILGLSPRHCGTLPFSFITWFVYSSYTVAKLCLILSSGIPTELVQADMKNNKTSMDDMHDPIHGLDSNLLKVAVGLSALVFIIMLQAHHNHDPDSPHSGYITGVCHNIASCLKQRLQFLILATRYVSEHLILLLPRRIHHLIHQYHHDS